MLFYFLIRSRIVALIVSLEKERNERNLQTRFHFAFSIKCTQQDCAHRDEN